MPPENELGILFTADPDAEHTSVMIGFPVPPDVAAQLAIEGGVPAEEMHITLCYCPDAAASSDELLARAVLMVRDLATWHRPLVGRIGGVGRFNASNTSDGQDVIYAVVDVPGLDRLREHLINWMGEIGFPVAKAHGFNPHITLAYIDKEAESPVETLPTIPIVLDSLMLCIGDRKSVTPLSGDMGGLESGFVFSELGADALADGRPFDAMASGTFTDMYGRSIKIEAKDLPEFVANTQAAIQAARTESGELVGLPIDAHGHDKGDGAGWIVGVEMEGEKIRFLPKWTKIGRELIGDGIRRFFSATVDVARKVVLGGTLTNWPATRDKAGKVMLRPIELSIFSPAAVANPAPIMEDDMTKEEIVALVGDTIKSVLSVQLPAMLAQHAPPPVPSGNGNGTGSAQLDSELIDALGLGEMSAAAQERIHSLVGQQVAAAQKAAEMAFQRKLVEANRKRVVAEFSSRVTGGSDEAPRGLPVDSDKLSEAVLKLPAEQQKFWMELCEAVVKDGLIQFTELGHGRKLTGVVPLPADIARELDAGELTLADLSNPIIAPALGDLDQYDLSRWQG
jgi:2'-5' RNA ligase